MTRLRRLTAALALALVAALMAPGAAHAVGYQFWGFFQLTDDEWGFASEGAGTFVPDDGTVEGYRFAVSADDDVRVPRAVLTFDEICADTPAEDGMKRVGVVVDPGRDVDAPEGETLFDPGAQCVVADTDATSQEVLEAAAQDVRVNDSGFICGIGGFPAEGGCGDEVAEPSQEQLAEDEEIEIPVVAAGEPIIAARDEDGAEETTDEPTATGEATDDEATSEPTEDEATDEATDGATDDGATDEATEDEATQDEATDEATDGATEDSDESDEPTDGATEDEDDATGGVPPWVWIAGVVVLVALLAWAATAARNRRLEDAMDEGSYPDEHDGQGYPGGGQYPDDQGYPGSGQYPDDQGYPGDSQGPHDPPPRGGPGGH